jgi:exodeoxyribonuclease VII large subunit
MFGKENRRLPAPPTDGLQVFVLGRPTMWEEKGEFRLTVSELLTSDRGGLWRLAFEKAKASLTKDGLLDPARKRALPRFPQRIAVVTSVDGAAVRDVIAVMRRRWPMAQILIVPARVQGADAESELCAALALLGRIPRLDLAIVGRGGGSQEDLWTFNSERVARAVAAAPVPIVSAVGHETDVTLCDLVADLRAATPSAAAEAVTPDRGEVAAHLAHLAERLAQSLRGRAERMHERVARSGDRLTGAMHTLLERSATRVAAAAAGLDALSPLAVLSRGYAIARDESGRVLRSRADFPAGLPFRLRVADGDVAARSAEG